MASVEKRSIANHLETKGDAMLFVGNLLLFISAAEMNS